MEWFIAVLVVAALGVAAIAAAGGGGEMSPEPVRDVYRQDLPERPLRAGDLQQVRFGIALRGYAMGQVDDLIDRLATEIADRDARIAELTDPPESEADPLERSSSETTPATGLEPPAESESTAALEPAGEMERAEQP